MVPDIVVYNQKHVLKDITLGYYYGAKIGVLGLNGSGKSTLLKIMAGLDDDHLGEVPAVFIEKKPGEEISKEELIDFCKGQISNFKIPRYIVFVDEWPMSSTKVQKFKLKNLDLGKKVFGN